MASLYDLRFDNSYARLPRAFHTPLAPTPFGSEPCLVAFNEAAAALIDLDPAEAHRPEFAAMVSGARPLPGAQPVAMLYAGHQFGQYVPQLGDGRAILLGEVRNRRGEVHDLHLKGAGRTPYSRDGDGRAVLRSSIREYLCGEAMHGLGIPTTRSLCIVGSDDPVYRERAEPGAMLLRLAPSHVRFGSFEVFYHRGQHARVVELADYVIARHHPELVGAPDRGARLLEGAVARTASLVARWQAVGFAHGVMNTDNMSILGLTLDYGPYGFMDDYDPGFVCNHSDHAGRYAFGRQPAVALWNLSCLAQALLPALPCAPAAAAEQARALLDGFAPAYAREYGALMGAKLGLREARAGDGELLERLLALMQGSAADYTATFRALSALAAGVDGDPGGLRARFRDPRAFDRWAADYRARLALEGGEPARRRTRMDAVNPRFVLRNYLAQVAIERAVVERDHAEIERLRRVLARPFDPQPRMDAYAEPPPEWGRRLALSCSS